MHPTYLFLKQLKNIEFITFVCNGQNLLALDSSQIDILDIFSDASKCDKENLQMRF